MTTDFTKINIINILWVVGLQLTIIFTINSFVYKKPGNREKMSVIIANIFKLKSKTESVWVQQFTGFTVYHGLKIDGYHTMYICLSIVLTSTVLVLLKKQVFYQV